MNEHQAPESLRSPKGVGISPRLFFSVIAILTMAIVLVLVMIFSYRGHHDKKPASASFSLVAQQTGISPEAAINQLDKNQSQGILTTPRPPASKQAKTLEASQDKPAAMPEPSVSGEQQRLQAARSQISVVNNFHGPSQLVPSASQIGARQANFDDASESANDVARSALGQMAMPGRESYQQQNMQAQKTAFLKANQKANNKFYLDSQLSQPISKYEVKAGTLIPATLLTGINSDLPGQITAQVSKNVYDTVTGNYLLIPQGTKAIGIYDSQVAYGQDRVLIAWSRLIFPNGDSFDLQGQPGADLIGNAGLHDRVNNHYAKIFGSALAFSLFGALGQLSQPKQANNAYPSNAQIIYGAIGQNLTQAGIQLTEKNINIQPTISIRPGANFNILLTRDMVLPGPYRYRQPAARKPLPQPTYPYVK